MENRAIHKISDRREKAKTFLDRIRGIGSTRVRAREVVMIYEVAAPIPNEMPAPDANKFLFELRELIADSVQTAGGQLKGWTQKD